VITDSKELAGREHAENDRVCIIIGATTQWQNIGLWLPNFPCPVLKLQLTGDHL